MFEIFNMGIGLMLAVKPENVERVKELLDEPVYEIGRIVKKDGASVVIKYGVIHHLYREIVERSV